MPLSALLSQALVAFTIECDNEAEHGTPHRTTDHGPGWSGDGAWLTSLVMGENCLRYVADDPITVGELEARARTGTNLDGMRRWGYITIDGTARKIRKGTPGPGAVLRATAAGLRTRQVWPSLPARVEQRWRDRFGADRVSRLTEPLVALVPSSIPGCPTACPSSARPCSARSRRCRRARTRPIRPPCRCRRCCPGSCGRGGMISLRACEPRVMVEVRVGPEEAGEIPARSRHCEQVLGLRVRSSGGATPPDGGDAGSP